MELVKDNQKVNNDKVKENKIRLKRNKSYQIYLNIMYKHLFLYSFIY